MSINVGLIIQKKIHSIVYRFVLIIWASFLISIRPDCFFESHEYVIFGILYFSVFLYGLTKPVVRLFNDSIFIFIVLIGQDPAYILNILFLTLPIINSINFSGSSRNRLFYFSQLLLFVILYFIFHGHISLDLEIFFYLIYILTVFSISYLAYKREQITQYSIELVSKVEENSVRMIVDGKFYDHYNDILLFINDIIGKDRTERIYCFVKKGDSLIIVNGSSFVSSYNVDASSIENGLSNSEVLYDETIELDDQLVDGFWVKPMISDIPYQYFYFIQSKVGLPVYWRLIGFDRLLSVVFSKVSMVLAWDYSWNTYKVNQISSTRRQLDYVSKAVSAMHFLRNRLSPLKNLTSLLDKYFELDEYGEKHSSLLRMINEENSTASKEIDRIVERADHLLDRRNNPFEYSALEKFQANDLFNSVRKFAQVLLENSNVRINVYNRQCLDNSVLYDSVGVEVLFSDWFSNMRKYSSSYCIVDFDRDDESFIVRCKNDYDATIDDIDEVVADLMTSDREEITLRTTHGLHQIKVIAEKMDVRLEAVNNKENQELELNFKFYWAES